MTAATAADGGCGSGGGAVAVVIVFMAVILSLASIELLAHTTRGAAPESERRPLYPKA